MTDKQSYIFNFTRVDRFLRDINRQGCFKTDDMDGETNKFRFVLATSLPSKNINDFLTSDGKLNNLVRTYNADSSEGECSILYNDGINGDATISIGSGQVSFDIGDVDIMVEGIFLVSDTGYVIAYDVLNSPIAVTNQVVLPVSGVLWQIKNEI